MPVFRYFVVVGALLMSGLYVLAERVSPQPLPPYFGQTAELPKPYHETRDFSARQQAAQRDVPVNVETTSAPSSSPVVVSDKPAKTKNATRHAPARPTVARATPRDRVRTVSSDMMVTIRSE